MHTMGIDIGTTTISVVLLDVDSGELIGRRTIEHRAFCKGILPEQRVQDPERIWMLVSNALQELVEMHGKPCGIGLTGQMHGMLYVDETGRAVSPLYTWQDRGGDQIWKDGLTYAQFLKASAGDAASGYGLTTHYYLQQTGRIPKTAAKMTTISDYMIMRLTGNRCLQRTWRPAGAALIWRKTVSVWRRFSLLAWMYPAFRAFVQDMRSQDGQKKGFRSCVLSGIIRRV